MHELTEKVLANNSREVKALLSKAPFDWKKPLKDSLPPLHAAVTKANMEMIGILLDGMHPIDALDNQAKSKGTALHLAASLGYLKICTLLLERGANVNASNVFGNTPLFEAGKKEDIGRLLLAHGANPDLPNRFGISALRNAAMAFDWLRKELGFNEFLPKTASLAEAARFGDKEGLEYYLKRGDAVNQQFAYQKTALMLAAEHGKLACILLLLQAGADLHLQDELGNTALHCALFARQKEAFEALVEAGAQQQISNKAGLLAQWTH